MKVLNGVAVLVTRRQQLDIRPEAEKMVSDRGYPAPPKVTPSCG